MHTRFYDIYRCKAYNKLWRAADIISHSLSERRSIFNASQWLKLSNVTGCFTAYVGVHCPATQLDKVIWFRLWSGLFRECQKLMAQLEIVLPFSHCFFQNTPGLAVLVCSIYTNLNYGITMLLISTGTNKFFLEKKLTFFCKFKIGNWERGCSQVTFLNMETSAVQF